MEKEAKNVLVTGGTGFVGSNLVKEFRDSGSRVSYTFLKGSLKIEGTNDYGADISNYNEVSRAVSNAMPEILIHSAALTSMELCEADKKLAESINVIGTKNLIDAFKEIGGRRFVLISTELVFDGNKDIYSEDDQPNPVSYYGATKRQAEELVAGSGLDYLILRTAQPYGWGLQGQRENNVMRVIRILGGGGVDREPTDWYSTPTSIGDFCAAARMLVEKGKKGVYHVVGDEYMSRYEWALKIAKRFGFENGSIIKINLNDLNLTAKRPNVRLSNNKTCAELKINFKSMEAGLSEMKSVQEHQPK